MEFDLVDGGRDFAGFEDEIQVLGEVVADADGFREALFFQVFHLLPLVLVVCFAVGEEGGVD